MVWASLAQTELIKDEMTEREAGQRGWKRKEGRFCFFFITVAVCPKSAGVIVNVQSRPITSDHYNAAAANCTRTEYSLRRKQMHVGFNQDLTTEQRVHQRRERQRVNARV